MINLNIPQITNPVIKISINMIAASGSLLRSKKLLGGEHMKNKKNILMTAAVAGLIAGITAPQAFAGDAMPAASTTKDANACSGKEGCNGKDSCKGKESCKAHTEEHGHDHEDGEDHKAH